jgi:hypothetical protein
MANPNQREIDRLLTRLAEAREEHQVWGARMQRYAERKDSPEYQEAFRRSHAAHNNIQDIRAQLKSFGIDV